MNILYVENHAVFAKQVTGQFLHAHHVTVVASLAAARNALSRGGFDLILCDYDLDDGKGDTFVRECRVTHCRLPIIAVSAHEAGNAALIAAGASAICSKMQFDSIEQVIGRLDETLALRVVSDYKKIFKAITSDPRYQRNLDWGKARPGHPEGTVRAHIVELERNVERLRAKLSETDYWKLKVLVHTHDAFKAEAEPGVVIKAAKSHASLARAFLAEFCDDPDMLAMVQYHDEPYALWRQFEAKGRFNQDRFKALLTAITDWNLFLAFNIVDGCTEGKSREPLRWFFEQVTGRVESQFTEADIF